MDEMSKSMREQFLDGERKTIPVEYAHIISKKAVNPCYEHGANIYYHIVYKPIDEAEACIGFGSYYLDLVLEWLKNGFEIVGAVKTISVSDPLEEQL